jgi:hypothetical protein
VRVPLVRPQQFEIIARGAVGAAQNQRAYFSNLGAMILSFCAASFSSCFLSFSASRASSLSSTRRLLRASLMKQK